MKTRPASERSAISLLNLTFQRLTRALRHRLAVFREQREIGKRHRLMAASLKRNTQTLSDLRARLAPGQRLRAIVLTEHFGDIVACEPVIRHLRKQHAHDHIVWIVRAAYKELVAYHPQLDGCVEVTCLTEAIELSRTPLFDEIVDLHVNRRRCTWFGTVHEKLRGNPAINVENYLDYGALLEAFCLSAGLPALADTPDFYINADVPPTLSAVLPARPFLVLHATTNETARDWERAKWRELVRVLEAETSLALLEVGLQSAIASPQNRVVDLCGKLSLPQVAEAVRRGVGFIGVESGPAHFANAFQKKSLILTGRYRQWPRYMVYTGFLREHVDRMVLQWDGPVANLPVAVCLDRVRSLWPDFFSREARLAPETLPTPPAS